MAAPFAVPLVCPHRWVEKALAWWQSENEKIRALIAVIDAHAHVIEEDEDAKHRADVQRRTNQWGYTRKKVNG